MADRVARIVSIALIPPTVSTVVFTILVLAFQHGAIPHRLLIWLIAVLCSGLLQMLHVLRLRHERKVTAYDVPERLQRTGPYLLSVGISFAGLAALLYLEAAFAIWSLMWCYTINTLLLAGINRYWKISAHLMGLTGPATALLPLFGVWAGIVVLPFALLLGWARVRLRAHTLAQVVLGAVAGFFLTALQLFLLSAYGGIALTALW
jgi:membrane-associated phospholipid phosphatase